MALSTFFLVILFVLVVCYRSLLHRSQMAATLTGKGARLIPRERTVQSNIISGLLMIVIFVIVVVPFSMVTLSSFSKIFGFFSIVHPLTLGHWSTVLSSDTFLNALPASRCLSAWSSPCWGPRSILRLGMVHRAEFLLRKIRALARHLVALGAPGACCSAWRS